MDLDKQNFKAHAITMLKNEGVTLENMAEILRDLQLPYVPNLKLETCMDNIHQVLEKREVQFAILTGIEIDRLATEKQFAEPLQSVISQDIGLYGIDEILALAITNVYGSIGLTNFGYLDKTKPGIIGKLDTKTRDGRVHTFIDDIVCAIIAAAAARLAHSV